MNYVIPMNILPSKPQTPQNIFCSVFSLSRWLWYRSVCDVHVYLKYEALLICMYTYISGSHIMPWFGNSCIILPLGEQFL